MKSLRAIGMVISLNVYLINVAYAGVNEWTAVGPADRSVAALAIDPKNPSTLYAGTDQGVFKTTNKGVSWTALTLPFTAEIKSVAIDPTNPTTLYAGYIKATTSFGVLKSTNGGSSWTDTNAPSFPDNCGNALVVAPTVPVSVYVTCDNFNTGFASLFKSTDTGSTWIRLERLPNVRLESFVVDSSTPTTVYAVTNDGLFKSTNSGEDWTLVSITGQAFRTHSIAGAPTTPSTLYVDGTFRSTDGGVTWTGVGLPNFIGPPLVVNPLRPTTLYAGGVSGVVYTMDAGDSWTSLGNLSGLVKTLIIDPSYGSTLYAVASINYLSDGTLAGLVLTFQVAEPILPPIRAAFESPEDDQPVSGIGIVRGWAFPTRSDHTIYPQLQFVIDGGRSDFLSLTCCSERLDVQAAFPQFSPTQTGLSGWGGLFNWGTLSAGPHPLRITLSSGDFIGAPSWIAPPVRTVTVVKPGDFEFLDRFDLAQAQARISGNDLTLSDVVVRDVFSHQQKRINLRFRWFTNLQSFGMVQSETVATFASWRSYLSPLLTAASRIWHGVDGTTPAYAASAVTSNWESPNDGQAVSGIGIFRGWAFADEPLPNRLSGLLPSIQSITVRVDGAPIAKIRCCAERDDVSVAFPEHRNALLSGWAFQYNYGILSPGTHTINVQLQPSSDNVPSQTFQRTVQVVRVGGFSFIDQFDLSAATARIDDEEIVLSGVRVRDKASQQTKIIEVRLRWFQHSQALGVVASSS